MNAFVDKLVQAQQRTGSLVCVGLDSDYDKMPKHLLKAEDPVYEFNKQIIAATKDNCCAYKPNLAFYEALGPRGWETLKHTILEIPEEIPIIIDAKRGDIGNTAAKYAEAIFDDLEADAVTLNPYMGFDSIEPFLKYENGFAFILALTSNDGARDFQYLTSMNKPLYMHVVDKVKQWNHDENLGLVVGASDADQIKQIRDAADSMPFLIPGVGAQGGDLAKAVEYGTANEGVILLNISRGIIFTSKDEKFAEGAAQSLARYNERINQVRGETVTAEEE